MKLYFVVAIRNLRRHWRQSLAAILSVTAGFMALVLFEGYIEQTRRIMYVEFRHRMMFGDITIERNNALGVAGRSEPWNFRIDERTQNTLAEELNSSAQVDVWAKFLRVSGIVANGQVSALFLASGYELDRGAKLRKAGWYWNTIYGSPLEMGGANSVVVGQTLGKTLGCEPDPKLTIVRTLDGYPEGIRPFKCEVPRVQFSSATPSGQVSAVDLDISGLIDAGFKDMDARFVFMPLSQAQSLAHTADVSYYSVLLKDSKNTKDYVKTLNQYARDKNLDITAMDWRDHPTVGDLYRRTTGLLNIFRNFVILVILCISTLSVLNTLIKIVKERTREIGTWRSLGYTPNQLTGIFAIEAATLGLVGGILGVTLSIICSVAVNSSAFFYKAGIFVEPVPFSIAIVPFDYILSLCILSAVCVIASIWAARNTLKQKISENLIYA